MDKTVLFSEAPETQARLFAVARNGSVSEFPLGRHAVLGSKVPGNAHVHIPLESSLVCRNHGEFACVHGSFYYRDLGSANGTFLSGELLRDEDAVRRLRDGDVLRIDLPRQGVSHPEAVTLIYSSTFPGQPQWRSISLERAGEIHLGRNPAAGGLAFQDQRVSADHAVFFRAKDGWAIADLGSTNGVFLNGQRLMKAAYLRPLDVVRIVSAYFIFLEDRLLYCDPTAGEEAPAASAIPEPGGGAASPETPPMKTPAPKAVLPGEPAQKPKAEASAVPASGARAPGDQLVIRIEERSVWQRFQKKTLLRDIHLTIHSGEMVLILGGSGAGKTTFMNAVMGYEKATGQILHGATDIYAEYEQMKYEIGFVPQQDLLRGTDTVYDTLRNAAEMKLPKRIASKEMDARIESVLTLLGLQPERDNLVVKLSGGQRKRLSIAVEYISDPSLFFLDEPDSGLDGIMARSLFGNLRTIADTGKIVMVITHGPDRAAELFDKVIVLAKDTRDGAGKLAFFGTVPEARAFFETDSLEGIVRRINRTDEGGDGLGDFYIDKYKAGGR